MKCYTWSNGKIAEGIALKQDDRLGLVVYLGEASSHKRDSRRYEAISLSTKSMPLKAGSPGPNGEVLNPRVVEATPRQITLPAKPGMPEKKFFVLEAPTASDPRILVRINAYGGYVRDGSGYWRTEAGTPEDLIAGHGEFGDAGRLGGWADGLVVIKPGDVLRISPTVGATCALWIEGDKPTTATWKEYEQIIAVAAAEATMAKAASDPEALPTLFGMMPAYTYTGGQNFAAGIKVTKGATGPVVSLGEQGRGSTLTEVPLVGIAPTGETIDRAAVAELSKKEVPGRYSYDQPTTKVVYGLVKAVANEVGAVLLAVLLYTSKRCHIELKTLRGNPVQIGHGNMSTGDAGRVGSAPQDLYVLHEGDALQTGVYDRPWWVIELKNGKLTSTGFEEWEISDAATHAAEYVAKGKAPWGHVPQDWVGKVVTLLHWNTERWDSEKREHYSEMQEGKTGEVIAISPLTLNLGWDGQDRRDIVVESATWVKLETSKTVTRLTSEEENKRSDLKTQAEYLRGKAKAATEESFFKFLADELREKLRKLANGDENFATMGTFSSPSVWDTSLTQFVERGQATMATFLDAEAEAIEKEKAQNAGEKLFNFSAWHRRGGATNVGDGFVIRADGTLRERDSDDVRAHKSDGTYTWKIVESDELALVYRKDYTAAPHVGEIAHKPVGGYCTPAQLAAVKAIELELGAPDGLFGLDPEANARMALVREQEEKRLTIIKSVLASIGGVDGIASVTLRQLQDEGVDIGFQHPMYQDINLATPADEICRKREARVVRRVAAANGALLYLAYKYNGGALISAVWREGATGDIVSTVNATPAQTVTSAQDAPAPEPVEFSADSDGYFSCSCGRMNRLTKSDRRALKDGQPVTARCDCGRSGSVK